MIQNKCVIWEQLIGPPLLQNNILLSSKCYLWTEGDKFKSYQAVVEGQHIFCYKDLKLTRLSTVQSLINIEVEKGPSEVCKQRKCKMYPVSFWFPQHTFRAFYFTNKETQKEWYEVLVKFSENQNIQKHYIVGYQVDKGQFGEVFKGKKRETNESVALKMINYSDMIWEEHF